MTITTENKVGLKVKMCHSAQPTAPAQDQENTEETPQKNGESYGAED